MIRDGADDVLHDERILRAAADTFHNLLVLFVGLHRLRPVAALPLPPLSKRAGWLSSTIWSTVDPTPSYSYRG